MVLPDVKDDLFVQKGICLLTAFLFGLNSMLELSNSFDNYSILGVQLVISVAALVLFRWLHWRVRRVVASELGLQILNEGLRRVESKSVTWAQVLTVKKARPNLLNGFYLVSLTDKNTFYIPIEREPPRFSTLLTWYEAPTSLEQLCRKKGVWVQ